MKNPLLKPGLVLLAVVGCFTWSLRAEQARTLQEARTLSAKNSKRVLLEFYHDNCEYCDQVARDAESDTSLKLALARVVLLKLSVLEREGSDLKEHYKVGSYFPVFIMTDSAGRAYARWTGYTGVDRFINSFNQAMSSHVTVDERTNRCDANPTSADALFLADFFTDSQEYLTARKYVRLLQRLYGAQLDFTYRLFRVTADAVWNDLLPFDSLTSAADEIRAKSQANQHNLGPMAQIMANVARKVGKTGTLESYLMAGIEATSRRTDTAGIELHRDLLADYALHVLIDTAEALKVKKMALGDGWEKNPAKCFQFGEWCFRRNINLADAEHYVRLATEKASGDKFRATHLRLLAEICFTRGKTNEAIELANQAMAFDPSAVWFEKKLNDWRKSKE